MRRSALALCLLALGGCAENPTEGQLWGAGAGAIVGGGIGRAAALGAPHLAATFTPVGAVAGAVAGSMVGGWFDPHPNRLWSAATIEAAETGQEARWAARGLEGAVVPQGAGWTDNGGRACRRLAQSALRTGETGGGYSRQVVACRLADGTWEVVLPPEDEPKS
ncbi:surface antigen [Paramagnetospirillum caucaseum]|uniref:Surface antigen n=1 Tax=Paramagnetospirillum caucaseum TaxID=1244869 RepID=M2YDZ6_9PROT|nr:glycine zipper 2TM domain-containing protein [Paramagnetospirillum caucaseum]EME71186.1 surface antigen [Paramagnetospirillum caucaseum]